MSVLVFHSFYWKKNDRIWNFYNFKGGEELGVSHIQPGRRDVEKESLMD